MGFWGTGHLVSTSPIKQGHDPADGMDLKLIDSGYCEPENEAETLKQFMLDAPRMDVAIDGRNWSRNEEPSKLLEHIFSLLPKRSALLAANFCTQTALAPFFCSVKETLAADTHFVDGGRQAVRLDSDHFTLEAEKPFKVVDFDEHMNARVLFVVTLFLYINLETGHVQHRFSRSSLVEKGDWVYVDEVSNDGGGSEDGGGAEDIAATAERIRNAGADTFA